MERAWALAASPVSTSPVSNKLAIGFDEGCVCIELGSNEPVASMVSALAGQLANSSIIEPDTNGNDGSTVALRPFVQNRPIVQYRHRRSPSAPGNIDAHGLTSGIMAYAHQQQGELPSGNINIAIVTGDGDGFNFGNNNNNNSHPNNGNDDDNRHPNTPPWAQRMAVSSGGGSGFCGRFD